MKIQRADVLGMCFGVRDALKILQTVENPADTTVHGELVHNEKVIADLDARGFPRAAESERRPLPMTNAVLITAHGISNHERHALLNAGKSLIDTTCPLVTRAHDAALKLAEEGFHVLLIGKKGHVEVRGIVEDLPSHDIVSSLEDVRVYSHSRLGIMCQTTTPVAQLREIEAEVRRKNPTAEIKVVDTICHPTKDHQKALERLIDEVEAVVVVGGRNSNNTRQLFLRCQERGRRAFHIQSASDLRPEWFSGIEVVGLTAGTSTLDSTIDEVESALRALSSSPRSWPQPAPRFLANAGV